MKKLLYLVFFVILGLSFSLNSFAQEKPDDQTKKDQQEQKVDSTQLQQTASIMVNNTKCPVTGEDIDKDDHVTATYNGKTYNLCCKGCIKKFEADPEKYLNNTGEKEKCSDKE